MAAACRHAARPGTIRRAGAAARHLRSGNSVRIKAIEPIAVSLPMEKPVKMAGETVTRADNILVRIESDNGVVGWGEAASAPTMTGETVASMMAAVIHMAPSLLKRRGRRFRRRGGGDGRADVRQQRRQSGDRNRAARSRRPRHRASRCTRCSAASAATAYRCWRSSAPTMPPPIGARRNSAGPPAIGSTRSRSALDAPEADAARTRDICRAARATRAASSPPTPIRAGALDEGSATCVRSPIAGSSFFEQPVPAHDLAGMARIAAASRVPIGADEGIHSRDDIERHHAAKGRQWREPESDQARRRAPSTGRKPAVRPARHASQHLMQDRRIERRLGRGLASRRRRPVTGLGPDRNQPRPCRGCRHRSASHRQWPCDVLGPAGPRVSRSTSAACGVGSRNSKQKSGIATVEGGTSCED